MVRGNSEAREDDAQQDQGVVQGDADERYPDPAEHDAERHERRQRLLVREVAEERLHYRGAESSRQDEEARRRQREPPFGDEEWHQGGHGPLVNVREKVS